MSTLFGTILQQTGLHHCQRFVSFPWRPSLILVVGDKTRARSQHERHEKPKTKKTPASQPTNQTSSQVALKALDFQNLSPFLGLAESRGSLLIFLSVLTDANQEQSYMSPTSHLLSVHPSKTLQRLCSITSNISSTSLQNSDNNFFLEYITDYTPTPSIMDPS